MTGFHTEKKLVRDFYTSLDQAPESKIESVLNQYISKECLWRGFHPFNEQTGANAISNVFWQPFRQAFRHMQRRMDVFMAGHNQLDEDQSVWVVSMGHLMGLFDSPWLGIQPSGKMAFLRYCEFLRIEDGQISEIAMFFDIPHVMMQVGLQPFPPQTAAHLVQPGPLTHDGLMFEDQKPDEGAETLRAINAMV